MDMNCPALDGAGAVVWRIGGERGCDEDRECHGVDKTAHSGSEARQPAAGQPRALALAHRFHPAPYLKVTRFAEA